MVNEVSQFLTNGLGMDGSLGFERRASGQRGKYLIRKLGEFAVVRS